MKMGCVAALLGWTALGANAQQNPVKILAAHTLDAQASAGYSVASIGDVDGNGYADFAMGLPGVLWEGNEGGIPVNNGTIAQIFMDSAGRVADVSYQSWTDPGDSLGRWISSFSDVNQDGISEFIYEDRGAIWVRSSVGENSSVGPVLIAAGEVAASPGDVNGDGYADIVVYNRNQGLFLYPLGEGAEPIRASELLPLAETSKIPGFGRFIANAGDIDGNGVNDILVTNKNDIYIFLFEHDGSVLNTVIISLSDPRLPNLASVAQFGVSAIGIGDLDKNGAGDLLIGVPGMNLASGGLVLVFLNTDGSVLSSSLIDHSVETRPGDRLGAALSLVGTAGTASTVQIAVGAPGVDTGLSNSGAVHLINISATAEATVAARIDNASSGMFAKHLRGELGDLDYLGDVDHNGTGDLGNHRWILLLNEDGDIIRQVAHDFDVGPWAVGRALGDLDGDSFPDLVIGNEIDASFDDEIVIVFLNSNGTYREKIVNTPSSIGGDLISYPSYGHRFGSSVAPLGDVDKDGTIDIAVGDYHDHETGIFSCLGAVYILFMNRDGTTKGSNKLRPSGCSLVDTGTSYCGCFGLTIVGPGDVNHDSTPDLLAGMSGDRRSGIQKVGSLSMILLTETGSEKEVIRIAEGSGGWPHPLAYPNSFGSPKSLGDIDGDGLPEIVVYSGPRFTLGSGRIWITSFKSSGEILAATEQSNEAGSLRGSLSSIDVEQLRLSATTSMDDITGDGVREVGIRVDPNIYWFFSVAESLPVELARQAASVSDLESSTEITASVRNLSGRPLDDVLIHIRTAGDSVFVPISMSEQSDNIFVYVIPSSLHKDRGVEYYFEVTNIYGDSFRFPTDGIYPLQIRLPNGVDHPFPSGTAAAGYRLISVPFLLEEPGARSILESTLGEYDPRRWRFTAPGLLEKDLESNEINFEPGRAYWALTREPGKRLSTGPAVTVPTDEPFQISLHGGWNFTADPFAFQIPYSNLRLLNGPNLDVRTYQGDWVLPEDGIEPFEGYIVWNGTGALDTLNVDPQLFYDSDTAAKRTVSEPELHLQISARKGEAKDTHNFAEIRKDAVEGFDSFDRPEAPVIGDYVSLSFPHPEWEAPVRGWSTDARSLESGLATWAIEVRSFSAGAIHISFEQMPEFSPEFDIYLVDDLVELTQDLRLQPTYTVSSAGEGDVRRLRLLVGRSDYVSEELDLETTPPSEFTLHPGFPNPFSGSTTIRYEMPEAAFVRLEIFDLLGRRVSRLVDTEKDAGNHVVVWDGRDDAQRPAGSGVYFVRLSAGRFQQTMSISLIN